jgi:hypothetical protein
MFSNSVTKRTHPLFLRLNPTYITGTYKTTDKIITITTPFFFDKHGKITRGTKQWQHKVGQDNHG